MLRLPRTLLQFMTFSQLLVALPLLIMAGYALSALDRLADRYQASVDNVSELGRLSGEISEDVVHLKKNLMRYEIHAEAESLEEFEHVRLEWMGHLHALSKIEMLPPNVHSEIASQLDAELHAHQMFEESSKVTPLRTVIDEIGMRTIKLREELRVVVERDQLEIRDDASSVIRKMVIALIAATALTVAVHWIIRTYLARMISQFERAITGLGRGKLQAPIALHGPEDIRFLGRWLDWLRRRLLSLEQSRTQVLRHVSHELKTPLAAMREGTSLLIERVPGPLNEQQEKILGIVRSNVVRLNELIEGLLRLQLADHAVERIGYTWLSYNEIIEQVVETHRLIAQEKGCKFETELAPVKILAGREALLTIVHNIVSNAVKFSPPNGTVRIALSTEGEIGILDVFNQGPGIPMAERSKLFEPFFRGSAGSSAPGVGLGLAIAQQFAKAHRGKIEIADAPDGLAHFRVILPLRAPYLRDMNNGSSNPDSDFSR